MKTCSVVACCLVGGVAPFENVRETLDELELLGDLATLVGDGLLGPRKRGEAALGRPR